MNWKSFMIVSIALLTTGIAQSQANLLNATIPEEIGMKTVEQLAADNDKPLEYGYVDDRDILWSKVVWEYIDLNERLNLPYYYPIYENSTSSQRKSLFNTLLEGIKNGELSDIYDDSYFQTKLTSKEIDGKLMRVDTTAAGFDELNAGNTNIEEYIDRTKLESRHIEGYKIKGVWYFDKRQGEMKYRLLAIAPVAPDVQTMNKAGVEDVAEKLPLFWVWYPGARQLLHEMKVFNQKNSAYPISYDHMLNARRFSAIIYREENIYGNRDVAEYVKGNSLFQVLESDRIRESIRDKELDMWNY
ncbi:type IX secretion system ring subunit PorN/GldN [Urechidicola croceus]|uniref:Gliding motility protein GldN n=1 Tax=Urechidicola croceus TaxID=1850246 RepID=A0A1D8PAV9_9FLAO|nr:gliding motility protein GldN [Urechidicola croceus]AOW21681.1 gliding motility protein GldN [Urechidicola croceus]